jgi:hypothetical protein
MRMRGAAVTPPKRFQSATDRDLDGLAARKERQAAPLVEVSGEITGKYDGDELLSMRAKRPTDERIGRLEVSRDKDREAHGELVTVVTDLRVEVATMSGKLDSIPQLVSMLQADKQDALDARKHTRERWTKIIGGIFSAGVIGAIVHAVVS